MLRRYAGALASPSPGVRRAVWEALVAFYGVYVERASDTFTWALKAGDYVNTLWRLTVCDAEEAEDVAPADATDWPGLAHEIAKVIGQRRTQLLFEITPRGAKVRMKGPRVRTHQWAHVVRGAREWAGVRAAIASSPSAIERQATDARIAMPSFPFTGGVRPLPPALAAFQRSENERERMLFEVLSNHSKAVAGVRLNKKRLVLDWSQRYGITHRPTLASLVCLDAARVRKILA